jgi:hypothetical protein
MRNFVLHKIDQVKGKISFYRLEIDGRCEFNDFCNELEMTGKTNVLATILAIMDSVANLQFLPKTKYRELKGRLKSDKVKDFEVKKDEYRVYLFKIDDGNIVAFGGYKKDQKEDIKRLRRIKSEFVKAFN